MKLRSWMLLAALLAGPGWSQEAATEKPVPTAASFDLSNPAIKVVLRNTVATQTGQYVLPPSKEKEVEPADSTEVTFVPAEAKPPAREYPTSLPPMPAESNDFLSSVVDILVDELLFDGEGDDPTDLRSEQIACHARGDDLGSTTCQKKP